MVYVYKKTLHNFRKILHKSYFTSAIFYNPKNETEKNGKLASFK